MNEGRIGQYTLEERIARGGMAEVWRAHAPDGRIVCIKRLDPSLKNDVDFVEMFRDEASLVLDFDHENIVKVYELIDDDDELAMVMELVDGPSIAKVRSALEQQKGENTSVFGVDEALQIGIYLCRALHHAHTRMRHGEPLSIVHRDVSPQNVLLSNDGHVKLLDFGIAKATQRLTRTRTGALKGKCSYMAPEQARGDVVDHRADQFATGILLWEMLTGRRLFSGRNEVLILEQVARSDAVAPSTVRKGYGVVPKAVDRAVLRSLGWAPGERFADMLALERALQTCLDDMIAEEAPSGVAHDSRVDLRGLVERSARVATQTESGAMRTRVLANASTEEGKKESESERSRPRLDAPVFTDPLAQPEHTGQFFEPRRRGVLGTLGAQLALGALGLGVVGAGVVAAVLFAERETPNAAPTPPIDAPLITAPEEARTQLAALATLAPNCAEPCVDPYRLSDASIAGHVDTVRFDGCLARCGVARAGRFDPPSGEALEAKLKALEGHPCRTELLEDAFDARRLSTLGRAALADAVDRCANDVAMPAAERAKLKLDAPPWPKKKKRSGAVVRGRANELSRRGQLALAAGEYERAKERFIEAVDLDPQRIEEHERIGVALRGLGDTVGAAHHFRLYFFAFPDDPDRERIELFLKRYQQSTALEPSPNPSVYERHVRVRSLLNQASARASADAVPLLVEARALLPEHADVLERLATAYVELGRPDDARDALKAALKVRPTRKLKEQLRALGS